MVTVDMRSPATADEIAPWPDLAQSASRLELTNAAVRALPQFQARWGLTVPQMCQLVGDVAESTWHSWQKVPPKDLGQDRLTRISLLLGIYAALHALHQGEVADLWPTLPNTNPIFAGRTPVQAMIDGGIPAMLATRRLLDARRGGL